MTGDRLLRRLTAVVLCLYLAGGVAPRAMVFAHHHDGDEHVHVHAWGADAEVDDHDHDDADADADDAHDVVADDGQIAIAADDHRHHHPDHVHTQAPYPTAARAAVPCLLAAADEVALVAREPLPPPSHRLVPATARGPPAVAV